MQSIQTFDGCLIGLMKKHRITISDLTRRLHIKSNTTLSRVLHAQCSPQAAEHFFQMLLASVPPVFDSAELRELARALEVTRIGAEAYRANLEMWQLLQNEPVPSTPFPIESYGSARFSNTTQLRAFYQAAKSVTIHIVASLVYPLFSEVRDLIVSLAPSGRVQVHHYFSLEGDACQTIRAIRTALPALRLPGYHGYKMNRPATLDKEFLSQSHAIVQFEREDGSFGTHLIAFVASRCMLYENSEREGLYDMMVRRILDQGRWFAPIKEDQSSDAPSDMLQTAKRLYLQEKDRALYGIRPDIPAGAIPYELFEGVLRDNASLSAMSGAMLAEFKWIHTQRNRNIFEKKAPSHIIVQRAGLIRFAETGLLSNHPAGARPFTPAERIRIFAECLRRSQELPGFNLHLAAGELAKCERLEILCLDRLGVQFLNLGSGPQSGAMVTLSEFTRLYQGFYTEELLAKHVESDAVCHAFLLSLIDELSVRA